MAVAKVTAGVDLGGTKIQTVVLRGEEVVGSNRVLTPQTGDAADVIDAIAATVRASLEAAGTPITALQGVGVGTPGEIDSKAGAVMLAANVPGFSERVELGPRISEALGGVTTRIDNDVRVGVLGEFHRGAGRPYKDMLGVWVGTGVGGGLILKGELREGRGAAGEIGHTVVLPGGRRCACGRRGHLEAYAGRASLELRARKLVKGGRKTVLFKIMKKQNRERLSSGVYAQALEEKDKLTRELLDEAAWALGVAIGSVQNLLDLEAVIVGGGLGDRLGKPFVDRIVKEMQRNLFIADRPPVVLPTELGDLAGAVGASLLVTPPPRPTPVRRRTTAPRGGRASTPRRPPKPAA